MFSSHPLDGSQAAYRIGLEKLAAVVEDAVEREDTRTERLAAGLRAGLSYLADDPPLAQLLLVEPLAPSGPLRLEHERSLARLGEVLGPLAAGGLVSYLSGRVAAGETDDLPASRDLLLEYLLAGTSAPSSTQVDE